jgi:hypothetical protein
MSQKDAESQFTGKACEVTRPPTYCQERTIIKTSACQTTPNAGPAIRRANEQPDFSQPGEPADRDFRRCHLSVVLYRQETA